MVGVNHRFNHSLFNLFFLILVATPVATFAGVGEMQDSESSEVSGPSETTLTALMYNLLSTTPHRMLSPTLCRDFSFSKVSWAPVNGWLQRLARLVFAPREVLLCGGLQKCAVQVR